MRTPRYIPENPAPITTTRILRKFSTGVSLIFSCEVSVAMLFARPFGMMVCVDSPFVRTGRVSDGKAMVSA